MIDLELQILQATLDFMNENCVGPQKSNFLFRSLKPRFETITSFSYSYFISLFDNKEMITSQFVRDKIVNYDIPLEEKELTEVKVEEKIATSVKRYNRVVKKDNPEDYYYCTKTIRVSKYKMIKVLYQLFEKSGQTRIDIRDCYTTLQKTFNIKSFNMGKLKEFLQTDKIVLKSVIERLLIENTLEDQDKNRGLDIKKFLVSDREKWIKVIKGVGIEFIDYLSKNGIKTFFQFNNLMTEMDPSYTSKLELANPDNDKVLSEEDYNVLFGFIKLFTEDEFIDVLNDENSLVEFIDMYLEEIKKKKEISDFCKQLRSLLSNIHNDNKRAKIKYILPFEVLPVLTNYETVEDLIREDEDKLAFLYDYKHVIINYTKVLQQSLPAFLNEKFKLLLQRVYASNIPNPKWEKYVEVMLLRQQGYNLQEIGQMYGYSRERIRQVEEKYVALFFKLYQSENGTLTRLIRAFSNNEWILNQNDINSIFSFYPELFYYLLKKEECDDIEYVEDLDIYYFIDDIDWYKEILSIVDRIEGVLTEEQFKTTIHECSKYLESIGVRIPLDIIEKILRLDFKQNGTVYSRNRMGLLLKYKQILAKAFPNGIRIYEKEDLDIFRAEYAKTFNDNQIPENDRALYGRIVASCYLVGKGKYALKKEKYISDELANKIYNYIQESNRDIFLTNTLYATFENELKAEGIDNKYHLQGVLKELYYNKLFFSRDYISKTGESTSIYNDIYNYVKQAEREVSIDQVMNEFKNVPYSVIITGLTNENIIKLSGTYIHVDKLNMDKSDSEIFALVIDELLLENEYSNTHVLFDYLTKHNKSLLQKYNIDNQFKLFSIIQYYLQEQYEFRRPYFANKGVEIGHVRERIISYIKDNREVTFDELKDEFPEVMDSILYNTLSGDEIICCQKSYMHADNLNMTDEDKNLLKSSIINLCSDNKSHSAHELLMILDLKHSDLVSRYNIDSQFKLFSIIKCFFANDFEFLRPYFANKGVKILSRADRVTDFLRQHDEIKISDFTSYITENRLYIASITQYINEMKDEYVFKDKETIISVEKSKLNKYNAQVAENVLLSAMDKDGFIVASKFKNYGFLPNDVKWTDWLLYSCINKFSTKIKVMQTENQMRNGEPLFVLKSIPAENIDELKSYLKDKLEMNDVLFVRYLQNKGLLS